MRRRAVSSELNSEPARLTRTRMIMTCILCSEGDQMLQVFSCQATAEHRHRIVSAVFYYITTSGTESNLAAFWERRHSASGALSISRTVCALSEDELCVRSVTLPLLHNGADVMGPAVRGQRMNHPVSKHADSCMALKEEEQK